MPGLDSGEPLPTPVELWSKVAPQVGRRTTALLALDERISKGQPIKILEHLAPGSSRAVVIFPGGLDRKPDTETFKMAQEIGVSVVQVRYPDGFGFSLRREVYELLDHLEARHIGEVDLVTGSYGGISALMLMYSALGEEGSQLKIRSFFAVKAALQPSDISPLLRRLSQASFGLESISVPLGVVRAFRARLAAPDIDYGNEETLQKVAEVPTMLIISPDGGDYLVRERGSYDKYFPHAQVIEDSDARREVRGWLTGGHESFRTEPGLRVLEKAFLERPDRVVDKLPSRYRKVK